jgi:hypothetical protein
VSGNVAPGAPDMGGPAPFAVVRSAVGSSAGFTYAAASQGNLPVGTDLRLGPLADNGGPSKTHALLADSPALNAGSNPAGVPTDQRGSARVVGPAADIGAYEYRPVAVAGVQVNDGSAQRSEVRSRSLSPPRWHSRAGPPTRRRPSP